MSPGITVAPARPDELPELLSLLERSGLPQAGLADHLASTLVARDGPMLAGCAALELYDQVALLRSVAVEPGRRGQGLGQQLTAAALRLARERDITHVYLLTETAAAFFPRFGFRPVARAAVQPAVHQSVEWSSACPQSALVLELVLDPSRQAAARR